MHKRIFLAFISLLAIFSFLNCHILPAKHPNIIHIQRILHIDPDFTIQEQLMIQSAAAEWENVTNHFVSFSYLPYPQFDPLQPQMEYEPWQNTVCSKHVLIMKMYSTDYVIQEIEQKIGYQIAGYTNRNMNEECGLESIYVVSNRTKDGFWLRTIMLHELGHELELDHSSHYNAIMFSNIHIDVKCLTQNDLDDFCDIWGCNSNLMKPFNCK